MPYRTFDLSGETCYIAKDQSEWEELTSRRVVVFTQDEIDLANKMKDLMDQDWIQLLVELKKIVPTTVLTNMRKT